MVIWGAGNRDGLDWKCTVLSGDAGTVWAAANMVRTRRRRAGQDTGLNSSFETAMVVASGGRNGGGALPSSGLKARRCWVWLRSKHRRLQ
ncbi:hypothetical protein M0R45_019588 [Rubus argutus]|uniref:Uncharacterized protein n=1 Tax=Rubus argutus TaxID=59490 RepID=A0AAW1X6A1_RUBAR